MSSNPNIVSIPTRIEQIIQYEAEAERTSDHHRWQAAHLIAEELTSGTTQRALAKAIGKRQPHVCRMRRCWELRDTLGYQSFNEFYHSEPVRGPKRVPKPKAEPKESDSLNGAVLELAKRKVIKLELTPKEFKILQRAVNPQCEATEERNAAVMFIQSFKQRNSSIKEIPQLY